MKNKLDIPPEKLSDDRELRLYRRKTDRDDLIVLSLGMGNDDENLVANLDLDDVKISITLVSKPRRRECLVSEAIPAIEGSIDE